MRERIDFDRADLYVTADELERLPARTRAAWAAACVGRVADLVSPYFRERSHLGRCVDLTWEYALGARPDRKESQRLLTELTLVAEQFGDESGLTAPYDWAIRDGYSH